jgi:hypothetical protein
MLDKDQLDATKCWFIDSTSFGHKYAHHQEYNSEFRFWCPNLESRLGCVALGC